MEGVRAYDDYLKLKKDAVGCIGLYGFQVCMSVVRMLVLAQPQTSGMSTSGCLGAHALNPRLDLLRKWIRCMDRCT